MKLCYRRQCLRGFVLSDHAKQITAIPNSFTTKVKSRLLDVSILARTKILIMTHLNVNKWKICQ